MHRLTSVARKLRREATSAERQLWRVIRNCQIEGFRFRRQVVLSDYIVDFACLEARLIIEVDGATHASETELLRDAERERRLRSLGFAILRIYNQEVYDNLEGVGDTIWFKLRELRPRFELQRDGARNT